MYAVVVLTYWPYRRLGLQAQYERHNFPFDRLTEAKTWRAEAEDKATAVAEHWAHATGRLRVSSLQVENERHFCHLPSAE